MKKIKDDDVLEIMSRHQFYRKEAESFWQKRIENLKDLPTDREMGLRDYYAQPLMTDEEFLTRLKAIVKFDFPIINAEQAGAVYQLRAKYERLPPNKRGVIAPYGGSTVRLQSSSAKRYKDKHGVYPKNALIPVGEEELMAIFGTPTFPRILMFHLTDVLAHPLGRWGAFYEQETPKPKKKRIRKKKAKVIAEVA